MTVLIVCVLSLFAGVPSARAGDLSPWLGTYVDVEPRTGAVRAAVRLFRSRDQVIADYWRPDLVRRLGRVSARDRSRAVLSGEDHSEHELTFLSDWYDRELRAPSLGLSRPALRLHDDPVPRTFQYDHASAPVDHPVAIKSFRAGQYDEPSAVRPCELEVLK